MSDKWIEKDNSLVRHFEFENFIAAFAFLKEVAELAEKHKHHPEIYNVYNKVTLTLRTHDAGNTITEKDAALATAIDGLIQS